MALQQRTKDRPLLNAMQVSLSTKEWTVIVQVVEKHKTEESRNKATLFKKFVLTDMQGTKIAAVTFGGSIVPLDRLLIPFKRYKISNAGLKVAEQRYRLGEYGYQWVLSMNNLIEPIHDEVPHTLPCSYTYNKFSELYRFAERNEYVAIRGLVIDSYAVFGSGNSTVRDYILIDEEKIPIVLRLWENFFETEELQISARFPQPTLVVGLTLKVTTFHGLSLTTPKYNAYFMLDPPLSDAAHLYDWYKEHSTEIAELLKNKAYDNVEILLRPPITSDVRQIKDVTTNIQEIKTAWVVGKLELMPGQEKLWQPVCGSCKKYRIGSVGWSFTCNSCGEETVIIPRGRMEIYLTDDSGTLAATLFSPLFEKLTEFTVQQIYEADKKGQPLLKEVEAAILGKKVLCFVKFYLADKNYTIVQLYTEEGTPTSSALEIQSHDQSVLPMVEQPTKEKTEFFSPNTKAVLEEIADTVQMKDGPSSQPSHSKRTLMFGSIPTSIPEISSEKVIASGSGPHKADEVQSPTKKIKNQERAKEKEKAT